MKTWSIAGVIDNATIGFVRAASLGAVVVQGVFDAFTNQPNPNSHPIPGCPEAVECRTHGCAGDCSESLEYEADAVSCPMGGTCPPECDRDALACVQTFGPASEHAEALRRNKTSLAVSADVRDSAAESCSTPRSTSAACTDPSPNGDEGPAPVGHSPGRGAGHPNDAAAEWIGEAVPAISEVLLEHYFYLVNASSIGSADHCLCGHRPRGVVEWNRHAATLIAEALAPQPK